MPRNLKKNFLEIYKGGLNVSLIQARVYEDARTLDWHGEGVFVAVVGVLVAERPAQLRGGVDVARRRQPEPHPLRLPRPPPVTLTLLQAKIPSCGAGNFHAGIARDVTQRNFDSTECFQRGGLTRLSRKPSRQKLLLNLCDTLAER